MKKLSSSISNLSSLQTLDLEGSSCRLELARELGDLAALGELILSSCALKEIPSSVVQLNHLRTLIILLAVDIVFRAMSSMSKKNGGINLAGPGGKGGQGMEKAYLSKFVAETRLVQRHCVRDAPSKRRVGVSLISLRGGSGTTLPVLSCI
ncbi:hypothetical protein EJ110_NYTH06595 [Nymphaea thermarum]|nr:hypothetical protein EJ110_NYTH06595 [Nymphaea thermarum]